MSYPYARVADHDDYYSDETDDGSSEEYSMEGADMSTPYFQETKADLTIQQNKDQPIDKSMFRKVQTKQIHINFSGSLEDFQQGVVSTVYRVAPELHKEFKQNLALRNRHQPGEADLVGDTRRLLILGIDHDQQANSHGCTMNLNFSHVTPEVITEHGRTVISIPPNTSTQQVGRDVYSAQNQITRWMYSSGTVATPEGVKSSIDKKPELGVAILHVGSLPYDMLVHNIKQGILKDYDGLDARKIVAAKDKGKFFVTVPLELAEVIEKTLMGPIQDLIDSCVDLDTFAIKLERGDGKSFSDPKGIDGTINNADIDQGHVLNAAAFQTHYTVHSAITLHYVIW